MNRTNVAATGQLASLCARVDRWREGCEGKRSRVPADLWNAAVDVARSEGVYATSRATGLNYQGLKDRVNAEPASAAMAPSSPAFIEVAMPRCDSAGRTVIQLEGRGGDRLRVEATGAVDVVGLAHAFWSRQ